MRWSETATWGGVLPIAGDDVVIPGGTTIIWDVNTPALNSLTINGTLDADTTLDLTLTSKTISVNSGGSWLVGRVGVPYTKNMVIELNGVKGAATSTSVVNTDGGGVNRGILVENATWKFYGNPPTFDRTYLNADAAASATSLTFADTVAWPTGTNIAIANTKFFAEGGAATEARILNGATSGTSATVTAGLTYAHLGRKQYPVESTATVTITNASPGVVTWTSHGLVASQPVQFTTSGTLPTGLLSDGRYYYVVGASITANTFTVSHKPGGTAINTSSAGSGTHTGFTGGMSFTQGTFSATKASADVATELDERALVINLDRNIIIRAPNDSEWTGNGYGVHTMVMDTNGTGVTMLDGVQFRRCGQDGMLGRYPVHFHMLSYTSATYNGSAFIGGGAFTNEATNHKVQNCAIWESKFRMITIHGTCGSTAYRNVGYDILGHAIFLENGSERRNIIDGNVVMKVREPSVGTRIFAHDAKGTDRGTAGIWYTNPDNYLRNNHVSDTDGIGIWNTFSQQCFGLSTNVAIKPAHTALLEHDNNTSHSNRADCMATKFFVGDDAGNLSSVGFYWPTVDGEPDTSHGGSSQLQRATISRAKLWKASGANYSNSVGIVTYDRWTNADYREVGFTGAAADVSLLTNGLLIGTSQNTGTPVTGFSSTPLLGMASYHEGLNVQNTTFVNLPWVDYYDPPSADTSSPRQGGGAIRHWDLYLIPLDKGYKRNTGLKFNNSHPGFRVKSPQIDGRTGITGGDKRWHCLSGALLDTNGYMGAAGNYLVPDDTYFTYGLSSSTEIPPIGTGQGWSTPDIHYGILPTITDAQASGTYVQRIQVQHVDSGLTVQGTWDVLNGTGSLSGFSFRHFVVQDGERYVLRNPDASPNTTQVQLGMTGLMSASAFFYLAVEWNGATTCANCYMKSGGTGAYSAPNDPTYERAIQTSSANMAALEATTDGKHYWRDTANNLVWIKVYGGLTWNTAFGSLSTTLGLSQSDSDTSLYQVVYLNFKP
jgi:hypothetical protein